MTNKKTYKIALGGICLAFTVLFMFGASIVPGAELTLYALSSLFVAVMIIEAGVKSGVILYVAAVLLGLLIVPNKVGILPYACFFGLYGIAKYYIEKIKPLVGQIAVKVVFFATLLTVALVFFKGLLFGNIQLPNFPVGVLIGAGILFLLLYDFIYTLLIKLYRERFKREKKVEFNLSHKEQKKDE